MPFITGMFQSSSTTSGIVSRQRLQRLLAVGGFIGFEAEVLDDAPRNFPDERGYRPRSGSVSCL